MKTELEKWILDLIGERLDELAEWKSENYGCDLAYKLFEQENVNGSYFCNRYKTQEWIKENFIDLGYFLDELCEPEIINANPFSESEKFMVQIMLEMSAHLLGKSKTVNSFWNDEKTMTKTLAKKIKTELEVA